jgi:hypothetical protein
MTTLSAPLVPSPTLTAGHWSAPDCISNLTTISLQSHCNLTAGHWSAPDCISNLTTISLQSHCNLTAGHWSAPDCMSNLTTISLQSHFNLTAGHWSAPDCISNLTTISLQSHFNLTAGRWSAPDCIRRPSCRLLQRRHHPHQARPSRAHRTRTRVAADGPSKNRTVGANAGWAGHAHVHACAGGLVRSSERLCRPPSRAQVLHRLLIAC